MKKENVNNMTEGNVTKVLLAFVLPIFISNLFQQFYNVVDIAVIGHILGDNALAAVGATASLYSLVIGFVNGMTNGFGVVTARFFGAGNTEKFHRATAFAAALSLAVTILLTVSALLFLKPLLLLLHTPESILPVSERYISLILMCCGITFAYNLLSALLRAIGNSRIPLYALIIASLLNVVLDVLFVGGFRMDVRGAALATVLAQACSVLFLAVYIVFYCPVLHCHKEEIVPDRQMLAELFTTGLSMAMMLVLTNIGTVAMQGSINSFGAATITGHTAARKFHDLCILPLGTICTGTATFVSQNYGARKMQRIRQVMRSSLFLGTGWSMVVLMVTLLFGENILQGLTGTADAEVLSVAMRYLCWNVPFYALLNVLLIMRNSLQALGNKAVPLTASFLELAGKFAGVIWLFPAIGYLGICWVEPITWVVCLAVVVLGFVRQVRGGEEAVPVYGIGQEEGAEAEV